ncbi:hypothetical protein [Enterococcus faecalis]|uniref:hypothetical protein n=1 Tax=Enterococcus faecalis TaxID=1351 RepID=UPI003D0D4BBE
MNKEEIIQKAKDLIGEGNVEQAKRFIEEHKSELGEHHEKMKAAVPNEEAGSILGKVKNLFKK